MADTHRRPSALPHPVRNTHSARSSLHIARSSRTTTHEQAAEQDLNLWATSANSAEYEATRHALMDQSRAERAARLASRPRFACFPALPPELRREIWRHAIAAEPVKVYLTPRRWEFPPRRRCLPTPGRIVDYGARAVLPPILLVSREAHSVASRHYRRAFRGLDGVGGAAAGFPTELDVDKYVLELVELGEDVGLVAKLTLVLSNVSMGRGPTSDANILRSILDRLLRTPSHGVTYSPEIVLRCKTYDGPAGTEAARARVERLRTVLATRQSEHPDQKVPRVVMVIECGDKVVDEVAM